MSMLKPLVTYVIKLLDTMRYWEWSYIAGLNLIAVLLLFAFTGLQPQSHLLLLLLYTVYIHVALAFGFMLNNLSDMSADELAGKRYMHVPLAHVRVALVIFSLYLVAFPLSFQRADILLVAGIGLVLGIGYSAKPLRLKERGLLGVISPIVAQHLPFVLFLFLFPEHKDFILYLFGWLILGGILIEFEQQTRDIANDQKAGTHTFLTQKSPRESNKIVLLFTILYSVYLLLPITTFTLLGLTLSALLTAFSTTSIHHALRSLRQ